MATHSSILARRIPWTEKPGGLQSMGSQRVGQDWVTNTHTHNYYKELEQWKYWIATKIILKNTGIANPASIPRANTGYYREQIFSTIFSDPIKSQFPEPWKCISYQGRRFAFVSPRNILLLSVKIRTEAICFCNGGTNYFLTISFSYLPKSQMVLGKAPCCCSVTKSSLLFATPWTAAPQSFPVLHCLPGFAQTQVHCVDNVIQPSHPLSASSSCL